jgi:putative oxygen-independent coproporphyrinogen III oxidase
MDSLGIYISVPFCRSKCTYCNFASGVFPSSYMERYIERVREDLQAAVSAHTGMQRVADTIYLGGGTPSLLPPELLKTLFQAIHEHFQVISDAEITVECAPGQLADDTLDAMLECGVNRISFGVQSFIDQEAKATGRLHTRAIAVEDIRRVQQAGIKRVNADLIAGLPHQTADSWDESLAVLADTGVDHASIYMLEVDDDSRLGREVLNGGARYFAPAIPSDDAIADMYAGAVETLSKEGLAQYEISNFARHGAESVHNNRYWLRRPYLGLGVDAHSMLRNSNGEAVRFAATDDLQSYLSSSGWDEFHTLTRQEEMEEAWFLSLRLNAGVSLSRLEAEFGREAIAQFQPILQELCSRGLLEWKGDSIALTARGRLLSNEVFAQFLDVMEIADPVTV